MTVIIGFIDKSKVYIGGDRIAASDYHKGDIKHPKVFKNKDFIIGYTSSFRFGEILQYNFNPPNQSSDMKDDREYMITQFLPSLRKTLEDCKYSKNDSEGKSGTAIIGYRNKIYTLQNDWSILEYDNGIHSVGCGYEYALGAMSAMKDIDMPIPDMIKKAIKIVSTHSPFVSKKCDVLSM